MSSIVMISQSKLSKIEKGENISLRGVEWVRLCDHFDIELSSLVTGYIEFIDKKATLTSESFLGGFNLPRKYSYLMGSTVRTALPIINMLEKIRGEGFCQEFIKKEGYDLDYFYILNSPLNQRFVDRVVSEILFCKSEVKSYFDKIDSRRAFFQRKYHGRFSRKYEGLNSSSERLGEFVSKLGYYEVNSQYELLEKTKKNLKVQITPNNHLSEFDTSSEIKEFYRKYKTKYLEGMTTTPGMTLESSYFISDSCDYVELRA
tara:strand:+ start:5527 stop:6306 length:780 start_codon:yes stop_codon:yes gene_type:complete